MGKRIYDVETIDQLSLTDKVPIGHGGDKALTATIQQLSDFIKGNDSTSEIQVFDNYTYMNISLIGASKTTYKLGLNIYIRALNVPDAYISKINSSLVTTVTSDSNTIANALNSTNGYRVGYYTLHALETKTIDSDQLTSQSPITLEEGLTDSGCTHAAQAYDTAKVTTDNEYIIAKTFNQMNDTITSLKTKFNVLVDALKNGTTIDDTFKID